MTTNILNILLHCLTSVNLDEVRRLSEVLKHSEDEKKSLQENLKKQSQELDDAKSALTIAEVSQEDELVRLRQRHQEEVSSLQHIMRGNITTLDVLKAQCEKISTSV